MTGEALKAACKQLRLAIGDGIDNPDFVEALRDIVAETSEGKIKYLALSREVQDAMWDEVENHLNRHCRVEDEEAFVQAVAELEAGWSR